MTEERLSFQAEVSRLLDIVAHSLYSEKDIFVRELVSNAADACDKLRHAVLTQPDLAVARAEGAKDAYRINIRLDPDQRRLTIADTGIGMNRDEMIENLGTIARSGTAQFLAQLSADQKKDASLIGQFGVGFYSAFMVADKVEVISRRAGDIGAWHWTSDGKGEFTIAEAERAETGTDVIVHLKEGEDDFTSDYRVGEILKKYSDHIGVPIYLGDAQEPANRASALWTRSKSEIEEDQYKEFYRHVGHVFDDPWLTLHWRAEGVIEYTGLLFVPTMKPFDLLDPRRESHVKLYVKRVFITDKVEGLVPGYLRFIRGVVDSEDLPLNISREMLQHNPVLAKIKSGLTKRVLSEIGKRAEDKADYEKFWETFGPVLKEGLYEDQDNAKELLKLVRFRSTKAEGWTSLAEYVERMRPGQEAIYTITGDDLDTLKLSPQLEGFRARDVEVLLMTDPIDEFWVSVVGAFEDTPFKSVTRGSADLSKIERSAKEDAADNETPEEAAKPVADVGALVAAFKLELGDAIKDVRSSDRLTDSPVCLVADDGDIDIHLARLMKQHGQTVPATKRILEVNPEHPLIGKLATMATADATRPELRDAAWLLMDQARIVEGETLPDPAGFARRFAAALSRGLAAQATPR